MTTKPSVDRVEACETDQKTKREIMCSIKLLITIISWVAIGCLMECLDHINAVRFSRFLSFPFCVRLSRKISHIFCWIFRWSFDLMTSSLISVKKKAFVSFGRRDCADSFAQRSFSSSSVLLSLSLAASLFFPSPRALNGARRELNSQARA